MPPVHLGDSRFLYDLPRPSSGRIQEVVQIVETTGADPEAI
jgi:hypothetical protein